ncbi:hypothetical protein [Arcobacter sp. FWKO B]|uniref:hypothetical protein n=1 Tax=Arcobacter sp. FWKO B TaxID=2593672 RepID=UPI0018A3E61D|nr:hypothetical protein [Arcobacter sp. FWKO B]QOG12908.1 response regulator [Arcobacter sp. FWKO B]
MSLILIVDDSSDNRMRAKLALKNEGYKFIEAEDGIEALDKAIKYIPNIILLNFRR